MKSTRFNLLSFRSCYTIRIELWDCLSTALIFSFILDWNGLQFIPDAYFFLICKKKSFRPLCTKVAWKEMLFDCWQLKTRRRRGTLAKYVWSSRYVFMQFTFVMESRNSNRRVYQAMSAVLSLCFLISPFTPILSPFSICKKYTLHTESMYTIFGTIPSHTSIYLVSACIW